jgi:uncharacterized protein YjbI with pentapeptide repeats
MFPANIQMGQAAKGYFAKMRRQTTRAAVLGLAAILAASLIIFLMGPATYLIAWHDKGGTPTPEQLDAVRGRIFQIAAGILALGAFWYTARNYRMTQGQHKLAERGQITERFAHAIELLGSSSMDVRIGTVYILEGVARDSADDHPVVMEVLCSFVRRRTHEREHDRRGDDASANIQPPPPDVEAALTVIARRNHTRDRTSINLEGAILAGAHLEGAHLWGADLRFTDLREAHLHNADLRNASFFKADLRYAYLHHADVRHADLRWAMMEHVWANRTDFRAARFWGADLRRADLHRADLRNADLSRKEISLVTPPGSRYSMSHLQGPYPDGWEVSSHHFPSVEMGGAILLAAQLEGADLRGVQGLTREQVRAAANYSERLLPEQLSEPDNDDE